MKLIKFLTNAGIGSRRECEKIIKQGLITVNGKIISDYSYDIDERKDSVKYKNKRLKINEKIYIALNKPKGFICSKSDEKNRQLIIDLIKEKKENLFPVGRLDYNSEGLIFLTNDGDFAQQILHPRNKVKKVYLVKVHTKENLKEKINNLSKGIRIEKQLVKPEKVLIKQIKGKNAWIEITIYSGQNRIIRKLCEKNRLFVSKLIRTQIGKYKLTNFKKGYYEYIKPEMVI
ncbi:MAG TPA: pseudouridine synthase [bacterium]|nr:pseudouridine synthase [bacterium]HOL47684.1 pseudouridine synthase [bacterium]HPQ18708.1 pseudouridine synthase [bacterium]